MAQTLVSLLVHVIFSTKNREPFITPGIELELFVYMGGILEEPELASAECRRDGRPCASAYIAIE